MPHTPRESRENSPIRGIINQLNQHQPSLEKTRETLVSEDGIKRTKVVKKRRVVLSDKDKRRGVYLRYVIACGVGLLLLLLLFLFFIIRWVHITGDDYIKDQSEALRKTLHAQSIELEGASIQGFELSVEKLGLRFPENALIERIEFSGIKGSFSAASVLSGCLNFSELGMAEAKLILREGKENMQLPAIDMADVGHIERMICDSFNVQIAGGISPFTLEQAQAYLYYPDSDKNRVLLSLSSGKLAFEGWTSFDIKDARVIFTPDNCEVHAQLDQHIVRTIEGLIGGGHLELYQQLGEGSSIYGPYQFLSDKLNLIFLTDSRIKPFLRAQTCKEAGETARDSRASITFSSDGEPPIIIAHLKLKDIEWQNMPALKQIQQHIEQAKRDYYKKPSIAQATIRIESRQQSIHLSMREGEMMEPHKISIAGNIHLDASNTLSGSLDYALPIELTRVEYPDNISDPIFIEQGTQASIRTQLKGFAFIPDDDSRQLELEAQQARKQRPERNNIDEVSLENIYTSTPPPASVEQGTPIKQQP